VHVHVHTQGREKKFGVKLRRKVASAPSQAESAPPRAEAQQKSNLNK